MTVSLEVRWEGMSGKHNARISDISATGCFIETMGEATSGELVKFEVFLPGRWVTLQGRVAYAMPSMGFGLRFQFDSDEQQLIIASYVQDLINAKGGS